MSAGPAIVLIDGEHHPGAVRDALDRLEEERELAAVVFCGGEEKVGAGVLDRPEEHYGRAVISNRPAAAALRELCAAGSPAAVVDLADEPVLPPAARLELAALALHLGLGYEAPGVRLDPPTYAPVEFAGPKLAVIGTGKRTGKTAVAGHWAGLLRDRGARPVIVCMGRGGPAAPRTANAGTSLDELMELSTSGGHAASDYLEGATLAGVTTVGCRRVGGGLAGEPAESNVVAGAALAASLDPAVLIFEGSGSCIPPVAVDRSVCLVGDRAGAHDGLGPYRLLRADLALVMEGAGGSQGADEELAGEVAEVVPGRVMRCRLVLEPAQPLLPGARVALFSTGAPRCEGVDPVLVSPNLARREELQRDLDRAASERCDLYVTELKAAAVEAVAARAAREGAAVVFARNRPLALEGDLDRALLEVSGVG